MEPTAYIFVSVPICLSLGFTGGSHMGTLGSSRDARSLFLPLTQWLWCVEAGVQEGPWLAGSDGGSSQATCEHV